MACLTLSLVSEHEWESLDSIKENMEENNFLHDSDNNIFSIQGGSSLFNRQDYCGKCIPIMVLLNRQYMEYKKIPFDQIVINKFIAYDDHFICDSCGFTVKPKTETENYQDGDKGLVHCGDCKKAILREDSFMVNDSRLYICGPDCKKGE